MIARISGLQTDNLQVDLNINLQGVEGLTELVMLLLTRATMPAQEAGVEVTQPTFWPDDPKADSREEKPPICETMPAAAESKPSICDPEPVESETMLSLMQTAPVALQRKRMKASKKTQSEHVTSCNMFDTWRSTLLRSTEPQQSLLEWMRADSQLLQSVIRREFAAFCFRQLNRSRRFLSVRSVRKYWTHVNMVCAAHGVRLEPWTPHELKNIRHEVTGQELEDYERRLPTDAEISAIALHSVVAVSPYGDHSAYFYRWVVRFYAYCGLRTRDVIGMEGKTGLRKQDIFWDEDCPDPDINAALGYVLKNPGGCWVKIQICKAKKSSTPSMLLPVPAWLRPGLKFFCEWSHDSVKVFPSAQRGSGSLSQEAFSKGWNAILKAAQVDPDIRLSEGRGGVLAIRKYPANWWFLAVQEHLHDSGLADMVSDFFLHHSSVRSSVGDQHYRQRQAKVLPAIIKLLPLFPKPAADAAPLGLLAE